MGVTFAKRPTFTRTYRSFGGLTVGHRVAQNRAARATATPSRVYTDRDVQQKYGANNTYDAASKAINTLGSLTSTGRTANTAVNTISTVQLGKTSNQVLSSVRNAKDYTELQAAKGELKQGQGALIEDHNKTLTTYIDSSTQNVLSELGVNIENLNAIDGGYEKYEDDQKTLDENKNLCQKTRNNCNAKLPEVSEKLSAAEGKVATQNSLIISLKNQIAGMKAANQNTSAQEAQLRTAKENLKKAEEERDKFQKQKDALESAMTQCDEKKKSLDENKKDLENYHKAEGAAMDKTFEIARKDDKELSVHLKKLERKKKELEGEIKKLSQNESTDNTAGNEKVKRLQLEYKKMTDEAGVVFADLGALILDNDSQKVVKNSKLASYTIQNYDKMQQLLEVDQQENA